MSSAISVVPASTRARARATSSGPTGRVRDAGKDTVVVVAVLMVVGAGVSMLVTGFVSAWVSVVADSLPRAMAGSLSTAE